MPSKYNNCPNGQLCGAKCAKDKLYSKVFCVCDCNDLEYAINSFLCSINQENNIYKFENMVSLGCNCACGVEKIVLFYRKTVLSVPTITNLKITKTPDKTSATLGDTITYTVTLTNISQSNLNNVIFKDILSQDSPLIDGSFKVDGVAISGFDLSKGISIGSISSSIVITIEYKVEVISIPCTLKIINEASAEYEMVSQGGVTQIGTAGPVCVSVDIING